MRRDLGNDADFAGKLGFVDRINLRDLRVPKKEKGHKQSSKAVPN